MTKIALLLTGQLRTIDLVKYIYLNNIISPNDTDVFLSINLNNGLQREYNNSKINSSQEKVKEVIDFFKPVDYFLLVNYDKEWDNLKAKHKPFELECDKILFEQYFVVSKAYSMLNNYKSKTNKNYDIIIRLRFDQFLFTNEINIMNKLIMNNESNILFNNENIQIVKNHSPQLSFKFNTICNNYIYVLGIGNFKHYKYANDQFWFHNESLLKTMSHFYNNLYNISINCTKNNIGQHGAKIECILYQYLTNLNIKLEISHIKGIFIRKV